MNSDHLGEQMMALAVGSYHRPHISTESDETSFFWVAGRRSIEVDIPSDGPAYVRITDAEGREVSSAFHDVIPRELILEHLHHIAVDIAWADAARVNP